MHPNTRHVTIGIVRLLVTGIFFTFCLRPSPQAVLASDPIYYVTEGASSSGSGLSWDEPVSLSAALQLAKEHPETPAKIWVAAGTYYPVADGQTDVRTATFEIPENASLYGGFSIGSDFTHRDWATNQTILSGNIGLAGSTEDNSYHVVTFTTLTLPNNSMQAILDGFIIQDGNANSSSTATDPNANGGGGWIIKAAPMLNHLIIRNNLAGAQGGGIFSEQSNPGNHTVIRNSQILNNQARSGGGLASNGSDVDLINTVFYANSAYTTGGAIALGKITNVKLINVSMVNNTAQSGFWAISAVNGSGSYVDLQNSIVWNRQPIGSAFPIGMYLHCDHSLIPADSRCFILNLTQNMDTNPQFVDLPLDNQPADLRLQPYSPAINAGSQLNLPDGVTTDLAGNPRINGDEVDLGAFEAQQVNHAPTLSQTQFTLNPVTRQISSQVMLHDLIQQMGANDLDATQPGDAIYGVAITGYDSAPGIWEYSLDDGVAWQAVGPLSSHSALLLQDTPGTWLRFRLTGPFGGDVSLQLRAWDGADQWANASRVDISASGRTTPYSAEIANAAVRCLGLQTFLPMLSQGK